MRAAWIGLALVCLPIIAASAQTTGRPIALAEAYQRAVARSEALKISEAATREAQSRVSELWSSVLPRVSLKATDLFQDSHASGESVGGTFTSRERPEVKIAARQPLFSGFREFLAIKGAKALTEAARLNRERAASLLYEEVAASYFELLDRQEELATRQAVRNITADQVKELKERGRLGRSRRSEILAAESRLAQLDADIEAARGGENVANDLLQFFTGLEETLTPQAEPVPPFQETDNFINKAEQRHDVEARRRELFSAELALTSSRRAYLPTAYADANYYLKRIGFQKNIKWDVLLTGELPLYSGGALLATGRASQARRDAAQQALTLAVRRARVEAKSAARDLQSALAGVRALEKAVELAQANAKAQADDYRNGLVTNLDVLGSLDALQEARLKLDREKVRAALARVRLEVAAGGSANH